MSKALDLQIKGERYVQLRDAARGKHVTPEHLLSFLLSKQSFIGYRKQARKFESVYIDVPVKLSWELRNSLYIPAALVDKLPTASDESLNKSMRAYFLAFIEQIEALGQYSKAPRYKSAKSPEYQTYLFAYYRLESARRDLHHAEGMVHYFLSGMQKCEPAYLQMRRFLAASLALDAAANATETAGFNESYYGMDDPEDRSAYRAEYDKALDIEKQAAKTYDDTGRQLVRALRKQGDHALRLFGELMAAQQSRVDTSDRLNQADWSDESAFEAAAQTHKRAQSLEQVAQERLITFWKQLADESEKAAATQRLQLFESEADATFKAQSKND